jgi:hypothetical protein
VFDACSNRPTRSNTSGECRRVTDTSVLGRDTRPSSDTSVLGKGMRPSTDTSVLGKGKPDLQAGEPRAYHDVEWIDGAFLECHIQDYSGSLIG